MESQAAPERLGRYQLLEPIGAGPNGSVARAKVFGVAGFERQFAVKRISPELTASPAAAQQLSAAARSYGSLEHPRIARMSEFGVAQGTTFTAVELVTGLDAMRLVADAKLGGAGLPAGGALALVSQIARAVGYAHGRGLTHLGLAPTNVIVTPDGDVKVTDFGILAATLPSRPSDFTRLSKRIAYLAPEQLAGEASSAATDVFALGVIAYELVTGQRAYTGDTPLAIAHAVLEGPPPDPALPRPIVRVLQRCLARSPFERFPDARALADALDAALRVAPVPGTRKDIGAQVKATLDRLAALHEGELSGVLSLNLGTSAPAAPAHPPDVHEVATTEFVRPDVPVAGPPPLVGPRATPMAAAPPPTPPVPAPPPTPPAIPKITAPGVAAPPAPSMTMMGVAAAKRPGSGSSPPATIPSIPKIIQPRNVKGSDPPSTPPLPAGRGDRGRFDSVPTMPGPSDRLAAADAARAAADKPRAASEIARAENLSRALSELGQMEGKPRKVSETDEVTRERSPDDGHSFESPTREHAVNPVDIARSTPPERDLQRQVPQRAQSEAPTRVDPHRVEEQISDLDSASITMIADEPETTRDVPTGEMSPLLAEKLNLAARLDTREVPLQVDVHTPVEATAQRSPSEIPAPTSVRVDTSPPARVPEPALTAPGPSSTMPGFAAPLRGKSRPTASPVAKPQLAPTHPPMPPAKSGGALKLVLGAFVVGALAAGGYYGYTQYLAKPGSGSAAGSATQIATAGSAAKPIATDGSAETPIASAGSAAKPITTAGSAAKPIATAGSAAKPIATAGSAEAPAKGSAATAPAAGSADKQATTDKPTATAPSDQLQITSTPGGARVFIDGADQGTTPVKLPGSSDRHNIALLLPGHDLYVAEVDGHGQFAIEMKAVTPSGGPAGIKVIKCKKDRYYVYVDGKPTGMLCPTERIHTSLGQHTVEVYDAVSESRQKFDVNVPDDRLSARVRLE